MLHSRLVYTKNVLTVPVNLKAYIHHKQKKHLQSNIVQEHI